MERTKLQLMENLLMTNAFWAPAPSTIGQLPLTVEQGRQGAHSSRCQHHVTSSGRCDWLPGGRPPPIGALRGGWAWLQMWWWADYRLRAPH